MNRPPSAARIAVPSFPAAAKVLLRDQQLRTNLHHATSVIQTKRSHVVSELPDWQALRKSGELIREHTLRYLDAYLLQFEENCRRAGGIVHWARDAKEASQIVVALTKSAIASASTSSDRSTQAGGVLKIKSMTSEEIALNDALEAAGIQPYETDLAELIIQLGRDRPSHIVVPALHKNRQQIRELFRRELNLPELGESPQDLADAARLFLRAKFLSTPVAISGANFLIADTGGVCIVESEGNGRMCLTLPQTLITVAGVDKIIPRFQDLEVFLQLLPRSATGERMNPYNSVWTGVRENDGPTAFHVVLMDNARTEVLADPDGRETLHCIRCGACQNACPVYRHTGGHAYGSVYAGPIGAILTPQLQQMESAQSLPFASSLCGACFEVCPVRINIPEILVHLRDKVVRRKTAGIGAISPEALAMKSMSYIFQSERRFRAAQRLGRWIGMPLQGRDRNGDNWITWLPGPLGGWTQSRDITAMPRQTFRDWWEHRSSAQTHEDSQ